MKFSVKAINKEGITYTAVAEANSREDLYAQFRANGETFISAVEESKSLGANVLDFLESTISTVKLRDKIVFAQNLSTMLSAGLPLSRALAILERQTRNKKFKMTIASVNEDIGKGEILSSSIGKHPSVFSQLFVSMVKAGEESGKLADALVISSNQMEKGYLLIKKIRGALIYPSIIVLVMMAVGVLMLIYVVPALTSTFKELNVPLPISTQIVIIVSDFLRNQPIISLSIFITLVSSLIVFGRSKRGKRVIDFSITRIPIIGEVARETNAARTTRTLSSLLSSGVEVVSSINITRDVLPNSYFKEVLDKAAESIQKGKPISAVFLENEKLYPPLVGEMISVGEETGELSNMLMKLAIHYENEVDQKTKDLSTIIEPFLMVIVGVVVGFFAVSMITPLYTVLNQL